MNNLTKTARAKRGSSAGTENDATAGAVQGPHFPLPTEDRAARVEPSNARLMCAKNVCKSYRKGQIAVPVLNGIDLGIEDGEFVAIVGKSGSGKSTLLHLLATLDTPSAGEIHFGGHRIDNVAAVKRDALRNNEIGVVFQFYHLLPELTTLENVLLPLMIKHSLTSFWRQRRDCRRRATELLERVGLSHRLKHRPRELSGGEMQRVAIARSLMSQPKILLADEPTGNLDRQTGVQIMEVLQSLNADQKLTIVMVTHDVTLADQADRVVQLVEGRVRHA